MNTIGGCFSHAKILLGVFQTLRDNSLNPHKSFMRWIKCYCNTLQMLWLGLETLIVGAERWLPVNGFVSQLKGQEKLNDCPPQCSKCQFWSQFPLFPNHCAFVVKHDHFYLPPRGKTKLTSCLKFLPCSLLDFGSSIFQTYTLDHHKMAALVLWRKIPTNWPFGGNSGYHHTISPRNAKPRATKDPIPGIPCTWVPLLHSQLSCWPWDMPYILMNHKR